MEKKYIDDRHRWLDIKQQHGGMSLEEWAEYRRYEAQAAREG